MEPVAAAESHRVRVEDAEARTRVPVEVVAERDDRVQAVVAALELHEDQHAVRLDRGEACQQRAPAERVGPGRPDDGAQRERRGAEAGADEEVAPRPLVVVVVVRAAVVERVGAPRRVVVRAHRGGGRGGAGSSAYAS